MRVLCQWIAFSLVLFHVPLVFAESSAAAMSDDHVPSVDRILITRSKRVVVIDGQFYTQGDQSGLGEIAAILNDRIVVVQDKQMKVVFPQKHSGHA